MEPHEVDWSGSFERVGTRRSRCLHCGEELDHAGGRPQKHILLKHPEKAVAYPKKPHIEESPKVVVAASHEAGLEPPALPPEPDERSPAIVREETLRLATDLLKDPATPANARVAAARLISDIQGLQDMEQDEDEGEAEGKVVARFEKAIARKVDLEEEFRTALKDPATFTRVKRLLAEVEATL